MREARKNSSHGEVKWTEVDVMSAGKFPKHDNQVTKEAEALETGERNNKHAANDAGTRPDGLEAATVNVEDQDNISTLSTDATQVNAAGVDWTMVVKSPTRQKASPNAMKQQQNLSATDVRRNAASSDASIT